LAPRPQPTPRAREPAPRATPPAAVERSSWQDVFAFLLLVSASLVVVFVLLATRHYFPAFGPAGQFLALLVVIGSFMALGSLMLSLLRLYVRPAIQDTRARRARKRNP